MRIGIEAQRILRRNKHGMDIVAVELIHALQEIDKENQYFVFTKKDEDDEFIRETDNFTLVKLPKASYPIWEHFILPRAIKKYNLDLIHCTANTAPLFLKIPLVLTLHDVIFLEKVNLTKGTLYQRLGNLYRRVMVPRVVKKCTMIGTVSNKENRKATKKLGLAPGFIQTLHNGVGEHFKETTPQAQEQIRTKYGLDGKFIFALGNMDPRKNTKNIVLGFAHYVKKHPGIKLFLSDINHEIIREILRKDHSEDVMSSIVISGYLSNLELPSIYSAAELFLFPSLRESFGIPVLEAMACGTPVVTSNISSLPEVAGDAGLLINPHSPNDICDGIDRILSDSELYNDLRQKGLERAKKFTWKATARKWLDFYKEISQMPK